MLQAEIDQLQETEPVKNMLNAYKIAGAEGVFNEHLNEGIKHLTKGNPEAQVIATEIAHYLLDRLVAWEEQHKPKHCIGKIIKGLVMGIFGHHIPKVKSNEA